MNKLYWSIGEVADILGENVSLVRFWSNKFSRFLKPDRTGKGNRVYKEDEIETLKQIHFLVKDKGMTLEGAEKAMAEDKRSIESRVKALDSLKEIRAQLKEVRKSLGS